MSTTLEACTPSTAQETNTKKTMNFWRYLENSKQFHDDYDYGIDHVTL